MGIYTEKRDQLIEKIKVLKKRIASDTANLTADFGQQMSFTDKAKPYEN